MRKEITQADIAEYLVTQSDFDLELFVDRSLQERGITTSHGGSYFDSVTGKSRQYDVRAYAYIPPHCGIFFSIECKSLSKTFPLVVSRVPRPADDAYHELMRTWGRKGMGEDFQDSIRSNERMPLYRADAPVGKKTVQVGREEGKREGEKKPFIASDGETFDKWSQALSSAEDFVQLTRQHRGEGRVRELLQPDSSNSGCIGRYALGRRLHQHGQQRAAASSGNHTFCGPYLQFVPGRCTPAAEISQGHASAYFHPFGLYRLPWSASVTIADQRANVWVCFQARLDWGRALPWPTTRQCNNSSKG